MQSKATTISAYLEELPPDRRSALNEVRALIHMGAEAPAFEENLDPAWQQLAADLLSPAYRSAMADCPRASACSKCRRRNCSQPPLRPCGQPSAGDLVPLGSQVARSRGRQLVAAHG